MGTPVCCDKKQERVGAFLIQYLSLFLQLKNYLTYSIRFFKLCTCVFIPFDFTKRRRFFRLLYLSSSFQRLIDFFLISTHLLLLILLSYLLNHIIIFYEFARYTFPVKSQTFNLFSFLPSVVTFHLVLDVSFVFKFTILALLFSSLLLLYTHTAKRF